MALKRRKPEPAREPLPQVTLAAVPCEACGAIGAHVVVVGSSEQAPVGRAWCGVECAREGGWPWLGGPEAQALRREA